MSNLKELTIEAIKQGKLPRFLYKYRPINSFIDSIISKSSFWFARADSFNDPFDCNLTESRNIKLVDFKAYISKLNIPQSVVKDNIDLAKRNPSKIRDQAMSSRSKTINSYGLLSLSQNYDSILMWSHYAENHKGLVIELDLLEDPEFFLSPLKVKYQETYEPVNFFGRTTDLEYIKYILATKSSDWDYEQEIRILKDSFGEFSFKKSVINKVFFGCRCSDIDKKRIKGLFKSNGYKNVKFFESKEVYGKFKLNFNKYK